MINVIFNKFDYEISTRKREIFEKYNKVIQWGRRNPVKFMEKFFNLEFTDHQKYILLSTWYTKTAVWLMSRNSGKAQFLDTKVVGMKDNKHYTKCIKDLKLGDKIFDDTGHLTEVVHLNPIVIENVYEIEFEDGEVIECNGEHFWSVYDEQMRFTTLDTKSLLNKILKKEKIYVPMCKPLDYPYTPLEEDPYDLGIRVSKNKEDKIPSIYLYSSVTQRINLLEGLMDDNGYITKEKLCVFSAKDKDEDFLRNVSQLLNSLGIKNKIYIESKEIKFRTDKKIPCFKRKEKYKELPEDLDPIFRMKEIGEVRKTNNKKSMRCITVSNDTGLFLCGDNMTVTHNSYLSSPYIMARSILIPGHKTYILCPAGNQAQETFGKMEDLAKDNIASVSGATSVFWDELIRSNGTSDGFVHDKTSHHCELYNGSEVKTVNSVPKNIVGIRSNLNFYDEAGENFACPL